MPNRRPFLKKFGILFGLGALGVFSLLPMIAPLLGPQLEKAGRPMPPLPVVLALSLTQPLLLLALAVAGGVSLAPRLGLRSHLAAWALGERDGAAPFHKEIPLAVGLAIPCALVILAIDHFTRPWLGEAGRNLGILQGRTLSFTVMAVLYGGITEELLMRWGLATLFAWLLWKVRSKGAGAPSAGTLWAAIVIAAVLFGAGHLPAALSQGIPLTPPVIARTIVLNAFAGVVFGWLYARRSIEAAMLAHATVHLTWSGLALLA
jgi:hypothetical protein